MKLLNLSNVKKITTIKIDRERDSFLKN